MIDLFKVRAMCKHALENDLTKEQLIHVIKVIELQLREDKSPFNYILSASAEVL